LAVRTNAIHLSARTPGRQVRRQNDSAKTAEKDGHVEVDQETEKAPRRFEIRPDLDPVNRCQRLDGLQLVVAAARPTDDGEGNSSLPSPPFVA